MKFLQCLRCFAAPPTPTGNACVRKVSSESSCLRSREDGSIADATVVFGCLSCGLSGAGGGLHYTCKDIGLSASSVEGGASTCVTCQPLGAEPADHQIIENARSLIGVNNILGQFRRFECTGRVLRPDFQGGVHSYKAMQRDGTSVLVKVQVVADPATSALDLTPGLRHTSTGHPNLVQCLGAATAVLSEANCTEPGLLAHLPPATTSAVTSPPPAPLPSKPTRSELQRRSTSGKNMNHDPTGCATNGGFGSATGRSQTHTGIGDSQSPTLELVTPRPVRAAAAAQCPGPVSAAIGCSGPRCRLGGGGVGGGRSDGGVSGAARSPSQTSLRVTSASARSPCDCPESAFRTPRSRTNTCASSNGGSGKGGGGNGGGGSGSGRDEAGMRPVGGDGTRVASDRGYAVQRSDCMQGSWNAADGAVTSSGCCKGMQAGTRSPVAAAAETIAVRAAVQGGSRHASLQSPAGGSSGVAVPDGADAAAAAAAAQERGAGRSSGVAGGISGLWRQVGRNASRGRQLMRRFVSIGGGKPAPTLLGPTGSGTFPTASAGDGCAEDPNGKGRRRQPNGVTASAAVSTAGHAAPQAAVAAGAVASSTTMSGAKARSDGRYDSGACGSGIGCRCSGSGARGDEDGDLKRRGLRPAEVLHDCGATPGSHVTVMVFECPGRTLEEFLPGTSSWRKQQRWLRSCRSHQPPGTGLDGLVSEPAAALLPSSSSIITSPATVTGAETVSTVTITIVNISANIGPSAMNTPSGTCSGITTYVAFSDPEDVAAAADHVTKSGPACEQQLLPWTAPERKPSRRGALQARRQPSSLDWPFGVEVQRAVALDIAKAMEHLHSLDLVHGCLKPDSILLKIRPSATSEMEAADKTCRSFRSPFVCLLDPSACKADAPEHPSPHSNSCDRVRQGVGLPMTTHSVRWKALPYLAPEVVRGARSGKPADMFSYGALLWHLASGVPPYSALHPAQVLGGLVCGELSLEWPPGSDLLLRCVGEACLQAEPHLRPTATQVVAALLAPGLDVDAPINVERLRQALVPAGAAADPATDLRK